MDAKKKPVLGMLCVAILAARCATTAAPAQRNQDDRRMIDTKSVHQADGAQPKTDAALCAPLTREVDAAAMALQEATTRFALARRDAEACDVANGERAQNRPFGAGKRSALWPRGATIPVCWENPGSFTRERQWVQEAVTETWDRESALTFTGWGACTAGSRGIRILIIDDGALVNYLGKFIDGERSGMHLNFTFRNWSTPCAAPESDRESCIKNDAVHEFGHAIALTHEHNRPDTPSTCRAEKQGTTGDMHVTVYDPQSIMNYCRNSGWPPSWDLSALDVTTVRTLYGQP